MSFSSGHSSHTIPFFSNKHTYTSDTVKDWNHLIKVQTTQKNDRAIIFAYTQMESLCIPPDATNLPLVLKACARLNAIDVGKRIHKRIKSSYLMNDVRVVTAIVDFYSKCGFLDDARGVFDKMHKRDLVSWNAMLSGYVYSGEFKEAILLFVEMQKEGLRPNSRTVVQLLAACQEILDIRLGKSVHGYCLRNALFDSDVHLNTALIGFYSSYNVKISRLVFDSMVLRNIISWNAMVTGYLNSENCHDALDLFFSMLEQGFRFDSVTMLVVIQACVQFGCLELGKQIHQMVVKSGCVEDLHIANALLNMYSEVGSLELSCNFFNSIRSPDLALLNSMISIYVEYGFHEEAMSLFAKMQASSVIENELTIAITLSLCEKIIDGLRVGRSLHTHMIKKGMKMNVSLGNALLSMYAQLNCVESAQKVFGAMTDVDVISYNTLISGLSRNRFRIEALELFAVMQEAGTIPNAHTIVSLLPFCNNEDFLSTGRSIHGFAVKLGVELNVSLNTALVEMYMSCGDTEAARDLFERSTVKDLVSWNCLISGYIKRDQAREALELFHRMIAEIEPDSVTIMNILSSCTDLSNLPQGKCLHAYALRREPSLSIDLSVSNALITMYMRCGSVQYAEKVLGNLSRRNLVTWKAMISGYGIHGCGEDSVLAFFEMLEDGFQPNAPTFLAVLTACSHSGLVKTGLKLFHSMVRDFNIEPEMSHYGCVVDLLGRAGRLEQAKEFIEAMPIEPDASVWRALLSTSCDHLDTERAMMATEKLFKLEPMNPGNYVLLSNIYAEAGLWSEVRKIRAWLKDAVLRKPPGSSWIVIRGHTHSFTLGDTLHPSSEKIYKVLSSLMSLIRGME